jgi:Glycosyl hydrolase family 26
MSGGPGSPSVKGTPRSPRTAVGLAVLATVVIVAVIVALINGGSSPHTPAVGFPSASASASASTASTAGTTVAPEATSAGLSPGHTLSGVAGVGTAAAAAFGAWRGKPVEVVVDYTGTKTWTGVTQLKEEGLIDRGLPSSVHRVFSVPLIPSADNATLREGATGAYDQHFRDLAQELIDGGQSNATIRLGWEMTGTWFAWSGVSDPADWVLTYQKAVTAMRSVTGADFSFDWTVALGFADPEPMYPGDSYVDIIGADNYDASFANNFPASDHTQVWNEILTENWGLNWLARFASEHGKRISFGEWGVTNRSDGHGGGDDPYFIQQMHDWFTDHDVAYEAYFESTDPSVSATFALQDGQFPQAAQRYKELFGAGAAVAPSSSPTVPQQSSSPAVVQQSSSPAAAPSS